jgi:hypothetical protein
MNPIPELNANTSQPARRLKIENEGDFWRAQTRPKIRLTGKWLQRAGFNPGSHVVVICVAPGVIELRSSPPTQTEVETL